MTPRLKRHLVELLLLPGPQTNSNKCMWVKVGGVGGGGIKEK